MKFLIPIIFLVVSFVAFVWFVDPSYQEIKGLKKEERLLNEALGNSKELQAIRDKVLSDYNSISPADREALFKFMPDTVDNVRLVRDIDGIAARHGMTLRSVRVEVGDEDRTVGGSAKPYGAATLSFTVSAPYQSFLAFITELERSLRLVDITSIAFVSSDQDLSEYQVFIRTYWLK